jgi:hypothetical protein
VKRVLKRVKWGVLIVSILALVAMGLYLDSFIHWYSDLYFQWTRREGIPEAAGAYIGNILCDTPLWMLAAVIALVSAARHRQWAWLAVLVPVTALAVVALIVTQSPSNEFTYEVNVSSFPPPSLAYATFVPILVPLATLVFSLWSTPPNQQKPAGSTAPAAPAEAAARVDPTEPAEPATRS